ncbi:MAG TPA: alpha/beta fold hydrolase, partial [Micromonosporaceae bacterium]
MGDTRWTVHTSDGLTLAVRRTGTRGRPVLVAVHGYPDDASVWDEVSALLVDDFDIVAYDIRGAGASSRPRALRAYRLEQLAADLRCVIDEVSPAAPVHLLAHDWGSVQAFYALRRNRVRVASYTSISGPDLDATGAWMRSLAGGGPAGWARLGRQLASSAYIGAFLLPGPIELAVRRGRVERQVAADPSRRGMPVQRADLLDGLRLYRANL